ncbi:MAG TPA: hypothetical protein VFV30_09720 [Novosphingobium sp.]|nr:hypothetical protein [Novosphingobium sp.]
MALTGALALALLAAQAGTADPVPVVPLPPADTCTGPLYTAFDFWVGQWNVFRKADGQQIARSAVAKINGDCALREDWLPLDGKPGGTLSAPDMITGRWHHYWLDGKGARVDLEGGLYYGEMILAGTWRGGGPGGADVLVRVTFTRLDADSVRQRGEMSEDEGLTWTPAFDYLYLRRTAAD